MARSASTGWFSALQSLVSDALVGTGFLFNLGSAAHALPF